MIRTLSMEDLRAKLAAGEPLTVVDIRDDEARAEWSIPGSLHADTSEDPGVLERLDVPKDRPVVAVCYAGNSSRMAAHILQGRGFDAYSLEGGMAGWSLAWNLAETKLGDTTILQVRRTGKGCLSYVVGSHGEAVVVDPSLPTDVYAGLARQRGWRITRVLETHVHADHLSRARPLAAETKATLHYPETKRVSFERASVKDGDVLEVGRATLRVLATPGHTAESVCYLVDDKALLSGDTLFLDSIGRPDLEATPDETRRRAAALHASLERLLQLDPKTLVMPCHVSEPIPFDGKPLAAPLGDVKPRLSMMQKDAGAFVESILKRIPATPPNHKMIVALNERGDLPAGNTSQLEAGANRCAIK